MKIILAFTAMVIITGVLSFVSAALVMLFLGAAHSHAEVIPALGYWPTWWLTLAIGVATSKASISAD